LERFFTSMLFWLTLYIVSFAVGHDLPYSTSWPQTITAPNGSLSREWL